jgi:hypothetical protein
MAKHIIACSDGTWDGAAGRAGTSASNVLKLFAALAGDLTVGTAVAAEQERTLDSGGVRQIAQYQHGIGDGTNWLARRIDGVLGAGLVARVLRGYTFVSCNYVAGDSIVLVGFSRGAYTARALGGFITTVGLLDWRTLGLGPTGADEKAYLYAAAAWYGYQRKRHESAPSHGSLAQLEVHTGLRNRLGRRVPALSAGPPPTTTVAPYLPAALVDTGYIDVSGVSVPAAST